MESFVPVNPQTLGLDVNSPVFTPEPPKSVYHLPKDLLDDAPVYHLPKGLLDDAPISP